MPSKFRILQTSAESDRPPISYLVRDYFERFISDQILTGKRIIINSRWNIVLGVIFIRKGKYGPDAVFLAKGARTISAENAKLFEVLIPMQIIDGAKEKHLKTIELMYEAISLFLTTNYKKVTKEFMDALWDRVDLDYLLKLPYPAAFEEQKYLMDKRI